jgi:hypothetical protein
MRELGFDRFGFTLKGSIFFVGYIEFYFTRYDKHSWDSFLIDLNIDKQITALERSLEEYQDAYSQAKKFIDKYSYITSMRKILLQKQNICEQNQKFISRISQAKEALLADQSDHQEFINGLINARILRT